MAANKSFYKQQSTQRKRWQQDRCSRGRLTNGGRGGNVIPLFGWKFEQQKMKEKLSKCLTKHSKCKRGPHYYRSTEKTVPIGLIVPCASSCAFENSISYFFQLAVFLCLTFLFLSSCTSHFDFLCCCASLCYFDFYTLDSCWAQGFRHFIAASSVFLPCVFA